MMTKLEQVARALNPIAFEEVSAPENRSATMQAYYAVICNKARDQARAAIEAMREPTDVMLHAGTHDTNAWYRMIDAALKE